MRRLYDYALPVRLYRRALVMLPGEFRRRYAAAMVAMLADEWCDRRGLARTAVLSRALFDLLRTAAIERISGSGRRHEKEAGMRPSKTGGVSWLDIKLSGRMLIKQPGMTLIGGFGMAVAIAIGATTFEAVSTVVDPALPVEHGERVVAVQNWNFAASNPERRVLRDFLTWREELRSLELLGAFRTVARNLVKEAGTGKPVAVAEMTESGFQVAGGQPLLGRVLGPEDARAGAPPAVVIGYDAWQSEFEADPGIVGQPIQLGAGRYTVVGVMREGFAFPIDHQFWIPLQLDPASYQWGEGPEISVFGRLKAGVTLEQAQSELTVLGQLAAADHPEARGSVQPDILPYTHPIFDIDRPETAWSLRIMQLLVGLLLVIVAANLAILVYARTVSRFGEITVRSALGASRWRLITHLFTQAFLLALLAAVVGLAVSWLVLTRIQAMIDQVDGAPFWLDFEISTPTVFYVLGLAVLAGVVVGVAPALKATGRQLQSGLRELGGGMAPRLGRTWTFLIVAQVALAVALLPSAVFMGWGLARPGFSGWGGPAEEVLTAWLQINSEVAFVDSNEKRNELTARFADRQLKLEEFLQANPGVTGISFSSRLPGDEPDGQVVLDGPLSGPGAESTARVRYLQVEPDLFDVYGARMLAGRAFHDGDLRVEAAAVIVNQTFAQQVLGGDQVLGRRMRYVDVDAGVPLQEHKPGSWYEIVGIVSDFPTTGVIEPNRPQARVYHPMAKGDIQPIFISMRIAGASLASHARTLHETVNRVDPTLILREVQPLEDVYIEVQAFSRAMATAVTLMTISILLLSAAGIYALMSFTIAQRTREIGIRAALGAQPRRLVQDVFTRALRQLAIGVGVGALTAGALEVLTGGLTTGKLVLLPLVGLIAMIIGLSSVAGPARRALRIQPVEALRQP